MKKKYNFYLTILMLFNLICFIVFFKISPVFADNGAKEILVGQSCDLSGPLKKAGAGLRDGALAYFKYINEAGGIRGQKIRFITYDDQNNLKKCFENTEKLIKKDKVSILFAYLGNYSSKIGSAAAVDNKILFFAPLSGAGFLRKPVSNNIFNIRPGIDNEVSSMIDALVLEKKIKRISVFYKKDDYGQEGLRYIKKALKKYDIEVLNETSYLNEDKDIESSVKALISTRPGATIIIAGSAPAAKLIKMMRKAGSKTMFLCTSFASGNMLGEMLVNQGVGVVVSQVVPFPYYKKIPVVSEYNKITKKFISAFEPGFIGLEGFIAAKALCKILFDIKGNFSLKKFRISAESQFFTDLSGFLFSFNRDNHQGSDKIYFTQLGPGGYLSPIKRLSDVYENRDSQHDLRFFKEK